MDGCAIIFNHEMCISRNYSRKARARDRSTHDATAATASRVGVPLDPAVRLRQLRQDEGTAESLSEFRNQGARRVQRLQARMGTLTNARQAVRY